MCSRRGSAGSENVCSREAAAEELAATDVLAVADEEPVAGNEEVAAEVTVADRGADDELAVEGRVERPWGAADADTVALAAPDTAGKGVDEEPVAGNEEVASTVTVADRGADDELAVEGRAERPWGAADVDTVALPAPNTAGKGKVESGAN
ncbi:unnamed protein product [Peniophora sp. CBMAI 1063]|nr:unnamed protein product [Peniophora sp. CBMAI 1063]